MPPTTMTSVPTEVLRQICEYLDSTHPPSLLAFARASKACYAVSSIFLFRTIKITIRNTQQLLQVPQRWEKVLLRDSGFSHVRRLILFWTHFEDYFQSSHYTALHPLDRDDDESSFEDLYDVYACDWSNDTLPVDEHWQSVAHLMKQLPGLTDIFYSCPTQFPPCLLQILHDNVPRCRLHHYNFYLNSPNGATLEAHDIALVTSPCLYSIADLAVANDHAARALARRHAPRLKRVHAFVRPDLIHADRVNNAIPRYIGLKHEMRRPPALENLQLRGRAFPGPGLPALHVASDEAHGDFSALRVLGIDGCIGHYKLPSPSEFPSLVTLRFICDSGPVPLEYWDELAIFLHGLTSLTALQLRGWKRSVSIVPGLGPNLRKLVLTTFLYPSQEPLRDDHILQLGELCPYLEELSIEMRRSRGEAAEVARYRALGRLPRLQHLRLKLHASPPALVDITEADGSIRHDTVIEPWFDALDAEYMPWSLRPHRRGHVRDIFVNSAIDPSLARSIFETIDAAKAELSASVLPLESLKVKACNGDRFPQRCLLGQPGRSLEIYLGALQRDWLVERDIRDDAREVLHVREIPMNGRMQSPSQSTLYWFLKGGNNPVFAFDIWQQLWPGSGESNWWEDWKSWPLDLGTQDIEKEL